MGGDSETEKTEQVFYHGHLVGWQYHSLRQGNINVCGDDFSLGLILRYTEWECTELEVSSLIVVWNTDLGITGWLRLHRKNREGEKRAEVGI